MSKSDERLEVEIGGNETLGCMVFIAFLAALFLILITGLHVIDYYFDCPCTK